MTSSGTAHRTTNNGSILTTAEIKARIEAMFEGSAQLPRAEATVTAVPNRAEPSGHQQFHYEHVDVRQPCATALNNFSHAEARYIAFGPERPGTNGRVHWSDRPFHWDCGPNADCPGFDGHRSSVRGLTRFGAEGDVVKLDRLVNVLGSYGVRSPLVPYRVRRSCAASS